MHYSAMSAAARTAELTLLRSCFDAYCNLHLSLDLTRGKPNTRQVALSNEMLTNIPSDADFVMDGVDVRNYGVNGGLPSTRRLFASFMGVPSEQVYIGGNASLQLMYDIVAKAFTHGLMHSPRPWGKEGTLRFLCPSPGYDRHFALTQSFGMELIPIAMHEDGPDMDAVEAYAKDPSVKGIWCVPKYSNPDGYVYSRTVCERLAKLDAAAPDFTILWDNAYCLHSLYGKACDIPEILELCYKAGYPDRVYEFCSTSKITFAGSGLAAFACSPDNLAYYKKLSSYQTIGYSKLNEWLHIRFLVDLQHTEALMEQHASILRPKFEAVLSALEEKLAPYGVGRWTKPMGGYFVSMYLPNGTAKRVCALCAKAGVKLTPAGSAYPYGFDPNDSHLRLAPSYPSLEELQTAMELFTISARIAALEQLS